MATKKNKKKSLLTNLSVQEVSFCRKGMNPGAKVALFKSEDVDREFLVKESIKQFSEATQNLIEPLAKTKDAMSVTKQEQEFKGMNEKELKELISKMKLDDATSAALVGMHTQTAEAVEMSKSLQEKLDASEKEIGKLKEALKEGAVEKEDEAVAKAKADGASEEILKILSAQSEEINKMKEQNARREFISKAVPLEQAGLGKKEDLGEILRKADATDVEFGKALLETLSKAAKVVKESDLLKQVGNEGSNDDSGSDSIISKVRAGAAELRKSDPNMTAEQAESNFLLNNPELYEEYVQSGKK